MVSVLWWPDGQLANLEPAGQHFFLTPACQLDSIIASSYVFLNGVGNLKSSLIIGIISFAKRINCEVNDGWLITGTNWSDVHLLEEEDIKLNLMCDQEFLTGTQ